MKTSGVLLPPASLIGRAPRNAVSSWKSVTTSIPVSLVNCGKSGVIAFDQGWIAPARVIVWPENCLQSIAALAYIAAASSAKLHCGSTAMPDRAAPAAPNPLTKARRLGGIRPFSDFSPGAISVIPVGSQPQHCRPDALARRLDGLQRRATCSREDVRAPLSSTPLCPRL